MSEDKSIFEYISKVDEFIEIAELMKDEQLEFALDSIVKLQIKPDIPPKTAIQLIVQLQAIASKCSVQAGYYKNIVAPKAGSAEYRKKGMLYTLADAIENLVAALKYMCR